MRRPNALIVFCGTLLMFHVAVSSAETPETPVPVDSRLTVELVAMEPDVRTPTAIQVDGQGRVWVLENNTHFRPKVYDGPPTDRVLIMEDFGPNGRARKITTWAADFKDGMGLFLLPNGGGVIVSTRAETILLKDSNGDGKADDRKTLLKLDTKDDYPHSGLSSVAMGPDGKLYLGLGENHGTPWVLTGSDGQQLYGSDQGAVFRFNPDGTDLEWFALGFWNPFGLAFRPDGQLFALDNDPSGGSLCRLLHVVRGGDYGYRYRYGRTIEHPFLAWFGQIPGTLPPATLVGEAPCGMVAYRGHGSEPFPGEYDGELIGATWSEHALQRYPLTSKGASYRSKAEAIIKGGHFFRPSGVAQAPDGSMVVSDWVDGSYEVHGKGRVWRVRAKYPEEPTDRYPLDVRSMAEFTLEGLLDGSATQEQALAMFESEDPFLFHGAVLSAAERCDLKRLSQLAIAKNPRQRLGALLAMRRAGVRQAIGLLPRWLSDEDGTVRRAALQWISEEDLKSQMPNLGWALTGDPGRATFLAYLATIQMLESGKPDPKATAAQSAEVALDSKRPPELRALALRLLPTSYAELTTEKLAELVDEENTAIQLEAVRILAARGDAKSQALLRNIAQGEDTTLAAEAIAGLALSKDEPATAEILKRLANRYGPLAREAQRSLGTAAPWGSKPSDQMLLAGAGDPVAGRRLFFHPNGPRCYTCHMIEGRGTSIGPDLTQLGRFTPEEILQAIRDPSREIAPAYSLWHIKMKDGQEGVGIDLAEDNKSNVTLVDATAKKTRYKIVDIATREVLPVSMMPPGLDQMLSPQETRDLIAFLRESRE